MGFHVEAYTERQYVKSTWGGGYTGQRERLTTEPVSWDEALALAGDDWKSRIISDGTDQTVRQATVALLGRLPSSEWGNFWLIGQTLFGDKVFSADDVCARAGRAKYISRLGDELERMQAEGIITRRGHLGVRLAKGDGVRS